MKEHKYEIGGKTYIQRPLVFGQIRQLMKVMEGVVIPRGVDTMGLINVLGDKLPSAFAVVLTEQGKSPRDKDIEAFAGDLEFIIEAETTIQVVNDFLDCNPIASLLEKISGITEKLTGKLTAASLLKKSSASSRKGKSQKKKK